MHFVFRDHPTPSLDFLAAAGGYDEKKKILLEREQNIMPS